MSKTKRNKVPSTPEPPNTPNTPNTPENPQENTPENTPENPPENPQENPQENPNPTTEVPTVLVAGVSLPFPSTDAKAVARYYSLAMSAKGGTIPERIDTYRAVVDAKPAKDPAVREAVFLAMRGLTREDWGKILSADGAVPGVTLPSENPPAAVLLRGRVVGKVRPVKDGVFYGVTLMRGGDVVRVRATPNATRDGEAVSSYSCVLVDSAGAELTAEDHTGKRVPLSLRVERRAYIYPDTRDVAESLAVELSSAIEFATQPCDPATLTTGETVRIWDMGGGTPTPFAVPSDWRWEGAVVDRGTTFADVVSRIEGPADRVQWEPPAYITRVPSNLSPLATYVYQTTRDAVETLARTMYGAGLDDATVRAAVTAIRGNVVSAYPTTTPDAVDKADHEGKA